MKIAVCIFGQPRFYKEAAQSFREEFFDMPGHDVDVFIHLWDEIGYTPDNDINETNEKPSYQKLKDDLWNMYGGDDGHLKSLVVESPKERFNHTADSLANIIHGIRDDKFHEEIDWRKVLGKKKLRATREELINKSVVKIGSGKVLRYEMGQFDSISRVIELKAFYEKENNFEYDLVVKVRSDSFYVPKELYKNREEEDYYKHKNLYYSSLHDNLGGIGVVGHGLKVVCGVGNGQSVAGGSNDTGFFNDLEYIDFKDGRVVDIKSAPYDIRPVIMDNITDMNGMFMFPWKVHLKDWILCADTKTANRVWGGMLSMYTTYVMNDLVRFMGNRQVGFMPGGEVLNGFAALLNGGRLHQVPDWEIIAGREENGSLDSNKRRLLKIVHPDIEKRKDPFIGKRGEGRLRVPHGGGCMPCGSQKEMVERLIQYVSSDFDKDNILCKIYRKD